MRRFVVALGAAALLAGCGEGAPDSSSASFTVSVQRTTPSATGRPTTRAGASPSGATAPSRTASTGTSTAPSSSSGSGSGTRAGTSTAPASPLSGGPPTSTSTRPRPPACGTPPAGAPGGLTPQAIVFPAFKAYMWPQADVTLTACATSGLPVTYTFQEKFACTLDGTHLSIKQPGSCTITASQDGDTTYAPADPVTRTFRVDSQLVDLVWKDVPKSLVVGDKATVELDISSPSGPVTHGYLQVRANGGGSPICDLSGDRLSYGGETPPPDGKATFTLTAGKTAGPCNLYASLNADQYVHGLTLPTITLMINPT